MPTRDGGLLKPFGGGDQVKIYNRHESVEPTRQNRSTDSMTTVMLTSINICRAMLDTSEVRNGFIEQAGKYGHHAWFRRGRPNKQVALEKVVDNFIKEMQNDFPRIFLDYAWNNPTSYGCHFRHPYEGSFKGSDQYILLNGKVGRNRARLPRVDA